jgi:membrane protein
MSDHSPLSPEARSRLPIAQSADDSEADWFHHLNKYRQAIEVIRRTVVGVFTEGFVQAGNFAYLSLVVLFSFCVVAAAIAGALGQTESGIRLISAFFQTVPPGVSATLRGPVESAMQARSGALLWFSAAVSLWTTASLIESFRDVLNSAYGTTRQRYFWEYRFGSLLAVIGAVILAMVAFSAQVMVAAIEGLVYRYIPAAQHAAGYFAWGRIIPFLALFAAIYTVFRGLTPRGYRGKGYPKWPGAALVSLWWLGCTALLPIFLSSMFNYDLAYGSMAGVMVALIFFYLVGLGMVSGAQLNAALANATRNRLKGSNEDQLAEPNRT